jgi:hypothetical protein
MSGGDRVARQVVADHPLQLRALQCECGAQMIAGLDHVCRVRPDRAL